MPTILEGFNEQRTPMSRVCTVRPSTYSWRERKVQKRGIGEMLPVWVGSKE
ncbi:hypothetical protein DPMN_138335 [Dreissena polymorpha]|uniref:Uncharacterized protein n=1 Tax=Dreissena polymorpha TaxID=45954 RepID=A0A9D4G736_DREPO|nr:hypothetical protein DPMN_138335 [Dreissena polymorpha]